jgi:hypothetical protein
MLRVERTSGIYFHHDPRVGDPADARPLDFPIICNFCHAIVGWGIGSRFVSLQFTAVIIRPFSLFVEIRIKMERP